MRQKKKKIIILISILAVAALDYENLCTYWTVKSVLNFVLKTLFYLLNGSRGYHAPPQILAGKLTLLNQEGHIMPTTLLLAPPDFQTFLRLWMVNNTMKFLPRTEM